MKKTVLLLKIGTRSFTPEAINFFGTFDIFTAF